ncbi:adhesion G-protein coupled receptor G2-like [Gadus macrocephalus]|uniref:adhesion G-protein coupled receptor G2-like n=1 Tax=Gadus macrocephalus TaxID=80720 RepID=UPI0028CBB3A6|nr:adhesion G-protein coupled receptor G2-like [Gadus macrocephalus]
MEVSVDISGQTKNVSEIRSWLFQLFKDHLGSCVPSGSTPSSPSNDPPRTETPSEMGRSGVHLLQGLQVSCPKTTGIRRATCFVIVGVSPTVPPCCLLRTLCQAGNHSQSISGTAHTVERMKRLPQPNSTSDCSDVPAVKGCNAVSPPSKTCADPLTLFIPAWNLSSNCSKPTVSYLMQINVSVSGGNNNEHDVRLWLQELFDDHSDGCLTTAMTTAMTNFTKAIPINIFKSLDISCDEKTGIRKTSCAVRLEFWHAVQPCCLLQTLCRAGSNSHNISAAAHTVDRIGIQPANSSSECSSVSKPYPESCMATPPHNATCRDPSTVFSPLTDLNTTCPTEEQVIGTACNCSGFCTGREIDAYYAFRISITDRTLNVSYISNLISQLGTRSLCTHDSGSTCLPDIRTSYKDNKVDCGQTTTRLEQCNVIISFSQKLPTCAISASLEMAFSSEEGTSYNGQLSRLGLCGNTSYQDNPINSSCSWVELLTQLSPTIFCQYYVPEFLCQQGSNICMLLGEPCTSSPNATTTIPPMNTTLTSNPANTTSTPLNMTSNPMNTTSNPVNMTSNPVNMTANPVNTTSNPMNMTSNPLNMTSNPVNTTSNPMNMTSNPLNMTSNPVSTTSYPMKTTPNPLNTTSNPVNTTSRPVNMTSNPLKTTLPTHLNTTSSQASTTILPINTTSTSSPSNTTSGPLNTSTNLGPNIPVTAQPNASLTSTTMLSSTPTTNGTLTTAIAGTGSPTELPTTAMSNEAAAGLLLQQTGDVSRLNSSQVEQLVSDLEGLVAGPRISVALGNISVHIVSNLLGASESTLASSSNQIVRIVDAVGLKLVFDTDVEELLSDSLALSIKAVDGANFRETTFSIADPQNVLVRDGSRSRRSVRAKVPQGSIRLPPSLTQALTSEQQSQASRVQFNFYQKGTVFQDPHLGTRRLISGILGASVANLSIHGLEENVTVNLRNTEPVPENYSAICVYWDFAMNNGTGGWNSDGCFLQNSTDSETICSCNHLTSFAILLDLDREPIMDRLQANILTFITYIGCGLSAIFLSLTLLTYLAFEKLRKDMPSKILIQLCLALLLLNLVFLVDSWLSLYPSVPGLCISTAWFLHYFLLASFTWMGLEAVHMYLALVKVFNTYVSHYMLKFSLVGWGVPMVVVVIVIAVDSENYGLVTYAKFHDGTSDDFCWLRNDIVFYVAVVAYFCVIFLFNSIMFVVVMVQLARILRQNPHSEQHRSSLQDARRVAGVTVLLGLTWGFAFFSWGPVNLAFMYLFTIFNTLQGFFIFLFHCMVKENVRRQWRTSLCCGKLRLAENSDWSRTATQKTKKKSSVSGVTSLSSSESNNSSFLARDSPELPNGIESRLTDREITADEALNSDVILNGTDHPHNL